MPGRKIELDHGVGDDVRIVALPDPPDRERLRAHLLAASQDAEGALVEDDVLRPDRRGQGKKEHRENGPSEHRAPSVRGSVRRPPATTSAHWILPRRCPHGPAGAAGSAGQGSWSGRALKQDPQRFDPAPEHGPALFRSGQRGVAQHALGSGRGCGHPLSDVSSGVAIRRRVVGDLASAHTLGRKVKHQGRLQLSAVLELGATLQQIPHLRVQIDHGRLRAGHERHQEGIEVGLEAVGGDHHDLGDAVVFPARQQLVHRTVEGFPAQGRGPRIAPAPCARHSIAERGCPQDAELGRNPPGNRLGDEDVRAQRQMSAVLFECAHGEEEARVAREQPPRLGPGQRVQGV